MKHLRLFKDREEFNAADLEYPTLSLIQEDNSMVIDETPPTIISKYVLEEDISEGNFVFYSEVDGDNMPTSRSFTSFEVNGEEMIVNNPIINLGSITPTASSLDPLSFSEDSFIPAAAKYVEVTTSKPIEYLGYYVPSIGGDLLVGSISEVPGSIIPEHEDNYIRFNCSSFFSLIGEEPQDFVLFFADSENPENIDEINSYTPIINSYSGGISLDANLRSWPAGEYTVKMEFDRGDWKEFSGFFCFNSHLREIYCRGNFSNGIYSENFCFGAYHLHHVSIFSKNFIKEVGIRAFSGCTSLTDITIPEGVTSIGEEAFEGCNALTTINIPKGVTSIGERAFFACSFTSIVIPKGIVSIGNFAFSYCGKLTSINIPESVTSIGNFAFQQCISMTYCDFSLHTSVPSLGQGGFNDIPSTCQIKVPSALYDEWIVAENWSEFANNIVAV